MSVKSKYSLFLLLTPGDSARHFPQFPNMVVTLLLERCYIIFSKVSFCNFLVDICEISCIISFI